MRVRWVLQDAGRPGGVETVTRNLAGGLSGRGIDSEVYSWLPSQGSQTRSLGAAGWLTRKLTLAVRRRSAARRMASRLREQIEAHPDLVVILDPGSLSVAKYLSGTDRWGVHVHWSPDLILSPWRYLAGEGVPAGLRPLVEARMRAVGAANARLLGSAPFVVSLTRSHTRVLRTLQPVVYEIENPVSCGPVHERVRREGQDVITLGYVGRLSWEKGPDLLVETLAGLDLPKGRLRVVIAGSGPMEGEVRERARALGLHEVEFLGWVDNPRKILESIDILALPSRSEAVPLVLVEALAAGCQVVAADAGAGIRDILLEGRLGTIVPVDDSNALRAAIESSVAHVLEGHRPEAQLIVDLVRRHDPPSVLDRWTEILAAQTGARRPAHG